MITCSFRSLNGLESQKPETPNCTPGRSLERTLKGIKDPMSLVNPIRFRIKGLRCARVEEILLAPETLLVRLGHVKIIPLPSYYRGLNKLQQGFVAHYTILIIRTPQNSVGTYIGPYITLFFNNRAPKNFKLIKIELIYKAKKFKAPPFTI